MLDLEVSRVMVANQRFERKNLSKTGAQTRINQRCREFVSKKEVQVCKNFLQSKCQ